MVTRGKTTIGIRVPEHKLLLDIIKHCGVPIASTSANVSGQGDVVRVKEIPAKIKAAADLIIDAGQTKHTASSSVLDLSHYPYTLVRPGVVTKAELAKILVR